MFSLDTPQFIGRDSEFLIVIIMTGMGIKWSGEARKEELDKSVPTHFSQCSLCSDQTQPR